MAINISCWGGPGKKIKNNQQNPFEPGGFTLDQEPRRSSWEHGWGTGRENLDAKREESGREYQEV